MTKPSPLPWVLQEDKYGSPDGSIRRCEFRQSNGRPVFVHDRDTAELIVRAVNFHPRLVEALKKMGDLDCFRPWGVLCGKCTNGELPCVACESKELLKEVEEGAI